MLLFYPRPMLSRRQSYLPAFFPSEGSPVHHGVLFLDELPEFRRHMLEVLCEPLDHWNGYNRSCIEVCFDPDLSDST